MKIGEAIQSLDRSEDEKVRIVKSIIDGIGKPSEVYGLYASASTNESLWKKAQNILRITGFRPGKAKNIILSRVDSGIRVNNHQAIKVFWMIYHECIVSYFRNENPGFNQLLLNRDVDGNSDSTEAIFNAISKYSSLYDVTTYQMEVLYELWWFHRVSDTGELFSPDDVGLDVVKELLANNDSKNQKAIKKLGRKIEVLESSLSSINRDDDASSEILKLRRDLDLLKEDIKLESVRLEKGIFKQVNKRFVNLEKMVSSGINEADKKELEEKVVKNIENIDGLNKKIEGLEKKREERKADRCASIVRSETNLVSRLGRFFDVSHNSAKSSLLLKNVLNMQGAFYVSSESLFKAVCGEPLKRKAVKEIVFSPSFYLFSEEDISDFYNYEVLYLRNISSTFIEATVLPLLIKANSSIDSDFPKVFVDFDGSINSSTEALIRKNSIDLNSELIIEVLSLDYLKNPKIEVDLISVDEILSTHKDFNKFLKNLDVNLDSVIFERFVKNENIFKQYLSVESAIYLSFKFLVKPYIRSAYGETKCQVIEELLNGFIAQS